MHIETTADLFTHELRAAYYMEARLVNVLDELATTATNEEISRGFADHRDETVEHVRRVESAFEAMDVPAEERRSPVVDALDEERRAVEEAVGDEQLLDLFYLGAGMKTERIEMTTYEGLLTLADRLELGDDVIDPLEANLDEEEAAFRKLRSLSGASDLKSLWERLTP